MSKTVFRLCLAGGIALLVHGIFLFWQVAEHRAILPVSLPLQRVVVSLGAKSVAVKRPVVAQPEREQKTAKKKEIVPQHEKVQPEPEVVGFTPPAQSVLQSPVVQARESVPLVVPAPVISIEKELNLLRSKDGAEHPQTTVATPVILKATPLYHLNPPPQYPRLARRRGFEGVVVLEALIDVSGRVVGLKVFAVSGHPILDRAALKAVQRWQFRPGTIAGQPQQMWVHVPVRFRLQ